MDTTTLEKVKEIIGNNVFTTREFATVVNNLNNNSMKTSIYHDFLYVAMLLSIVECTNSRSNQYSWRFINTNKEGE